MSLQENIRRIKSIMGVIKEEVDDACKLKKINLNTLQSYWEDKLRKCIETDGIMVKLDGSIEVVTPLQSMDGNLCEGDHTEPHAEGGKTNSSNLGLLPKSDNRKKGKKRLKPA